MLILVLNATGQIDSLLVEISKPNPDTIQLELLNQLAFEYRVIKTDSTFYYAQQAVSLASKKGLDKWIGRSLYSLGVGHHIKGDFDEAISYYHQAIPIAESVNDQKGLSNLYNNLGLVDWNKGELITALDFFLQSYKIAEVLTDSLGLITSFNNIGLIYRNMQEEALAPGYFLKAEKLLTPIGNRFRLSQLHNNLGLTYNQIGKQDSSLYHYRKSLKYADEANCYAAHPLLGIADLFSKIQSKPTDSLIYYSALSLEVARKCGLPKIQSGALIVLGDSYLTEGDLDLAQKYFEEALELSIRYEIRENIKESHLRFYRLFKAKNESRKALENFEAYEKMKSSLLDEEKIREITLLEAQYGADKERQVLLAKQESDFVIYEQELERERAKITIYALLAGALVIVVFLLYRNFSRQRVATKMLRKQNYVIEELSSFKNDLNHMVVHDIKNPLHSIITLSKGMDTKKGKDIVRAGETILSLIANMLDLEKFEQAKPRLQLETVSMVDLIEEARLAVELLLHEKSIRLRNTIRNDVMINVDREMLTRVFVNLFSNAIKYSPSNEDLKVHSVILEDRRIQLGISDRGSGISEADLPHVFEKYYQPKEKKSGLAPSTGLGLAFCKMAIDAHDGQIDVISKEGSGTTFWITLPFQSISEPLSEVEDGEDIPISKADKDALSHYATALKQLKVHNVGSIMAILEEIEGLGLDSNWPAQLRSAVQYSNRTQYRNLLEMIT